MNINNEVDNAESKIDRENNNNLNIMMNFRQFDKDIERRLTKLESNYENLEKRTTENFSSVREDVREIKISVKQINDKIDSNLKWIIGTSFVGFISILGFLITIILK